MKLLSTTFGVIKAIHKTPAMCETNIIDNYNRLLTLSKKIVPPLGNNKYKGQAGRIGVIGGSFEYTGAPYFAAISALKVGADLAHVFCTKDAATVIKSYSPELIVHPLLDDKDAADKIEPWLQRLHVLVVGPGLGRDLAVFQNVIKVINICRTMEKPLVIDADGLFLVQNYPEVIKGYKNVILTPNAAEFGRLLDYKESNVFETCSNIYGDTPVILKKGYEDDVFDITARCCYKFPPGGSGRRCGGQGDLLSGALATFYHWAIEAYKNGLTLDIQSTNAPAIVACTAATFLTKTCNSEGFKCRGRSMTCEDMISEIYYAFKNHFEIKQ